MDIPETGAVFTLGKSFLSENHQSYFFIKNDPIKKLITGSNQSAVICESGRLFVWGKNQFGQLGTGSGEIITKPSCVKTIKNLGYKVRNIAFGDGFSVILTENSKIFLNGRSIFTLNEKYGSAVRHLGNGEYIFKELFEIVDFHKQCLDGEGNFDDLVDVVAGENHFVVLTSSGRLFNFGLYDSKQLSKHRELLRPQKISEQLIVRIAKCGKTFTAFVTDNNKLYLIGVFNGVKYTKITKLNTSSLKDSIYSIYISYENEIFIISSTGDVFKNNNETTVRFERIILFNDNDFVQKICTGDGFVCVLTDKNKFLTTYHEKSSSTKNPAASITTPRELRKFQDFHILDISSGLYHILLFAVTRPNVFTSMDMSSDPSESIITKKTISKTEKPVMKKTDSNGNMARQESITEPPSTGSKIPILAKKTLEDIYTDGENIKNSLDNAPTNNVSQRLNVTRMDVEETPSLKEFEKLEKESSIESKMSNIGDTIKKDAKAEYDKIMTKGQNQIKEIKEIGDSVGKTVMEAPKQMIDNTKAQVSAKIDDSIKFMNDTKDKISGSVSEEIKKGENAVKQVFSGNGLFETNGASKNTGDDILFKQSEFMMRKNMGSPMPQQPTAPPHPTVSTPLEDTKKFLNENTKEMNAVLRSATIKNGMPHLKSESIESIHVEDTKNNIFDQAKDGIMNAGSMMVNKVKESERKVEDKTKEVIMDTEQGVNNALKKADDTKEEIYAQVVKQKNDAKEGVKNFVGGAMDGFKSEDEKMIEPKEKPKVKMESNKNYQIIPLKHDLEEIDLDGDVETERTTASIKSASTPNNNPFDSDDNDEMGGRKTSSEKKTKETVKTQPKENTDGPVKRFFNEIKDISCKNSNTAVEIEPDMHNMKSQSMDDIIRDNKTSKVCTIL